MALFCSCDALQSSRLAGNDDSIRVRDGHKFHLQLHNAELFESFATVGWMDPYAVVEVDGSNAHKTNPCIFGHKNPIWNDDLGLWLSAVPSSITVSVWTRSRLRENDVHCGSVSVTCKPDMPNMSQKDISLCKDFLTIGKLRLSITIWNTPNLPITLECECDSARWEESEVQVIKSVGGSPKAKVADAEENNEHPTLLSPKKGVAAKVSIDDVEIAEIDAKQKSPRALAGKWQCVGTTGLEEFLKSTGVGPFQRKLAMAARWPEWDFTLNTDGNLHFVNHSAMGDLIEDIKLDGSTYMWKDGRGNPLECRATWTCTDDGSCLTIHRTGTLATYTEERKVSNDSLTFTLSNKEGASWGRSFRRKF